MSACPGCGYDHELEVTMRWMFIIPLEPPSQNEVAKNSGLAATRQRYRKVRNDYHLAFLAERRRCKITRPTGKRRVWFTRLMPPRGQLYDRGNLIGGMKAALDAMVQAELLIDDSPEHLEDHYTQEPCTYGGLQVVIEEVEWNAPG